jgi:hypothetical protein
MTSQQIKLRSQGSRNPSTHNPSKGTPHQRQHQRPQSGYERGLSGTLQKNDGWRDDSLLSEAGKICFYPLSFDVLETLSFPRAKKGSTAAAIVSAAAVAAAAVTVIVTVAVIVAAVTVAAHCTMFIF